MNRKFRRLQLAIDTITFDKIVELQKIFNYQSITETVRRSIDLLYLLRKQEQDGYEFLMKKDGIIVKVMLL